MSNTAPSKADPVVVFPLSRWCPPQETSQHHPPQHYVEQNHLQQTTVATFTNMV